MRRRHLQHNRGTRNTKLNHCLQICTYQTKMAPELGKLSESEQKLFQILNTGDIDEVKALLKQPDVNVNCLDDSGMTPLAQAAFRGNDELCRELLAHGADVNSNHHQHGYTVLMFAALSGKTEVTQTILEAGANVSVENAVHRNAAQMAAFVGQHQCVSVINNFFSKQDLEYYCRPNGLETEPKLPPTLCDPLYKLISSHNLNPLKMSLLLQACPEMFSEPKKIQRVLDLLVEKMMKQKETNEVMAFKFHFLSAIYKECVKWRNDKEDNLDGWIKRLSRGRDSDGCQEAQEQFVRSMLKTFPYIDSQLLQQMVRTLAPLQIGQSPSAVSVLSSGINGQRFASMEDALCTLCSEFHAEKKCSACKAANYCDQKCQKLDWPTHKKFCKEMKEQRIENERLKAEEEALERQKEAEESKAQLEQASAQLSEATEVVTDTIAKESSEPEPPAAVEKPED